MDDGRLERIRGQLRSIRCDLAELEVRRSRAVAAAAAHTRPAAASRTAQLQAQLDEALGELEGLRAAMAHRATIEQAKGMNMVCLDVDEDTAFAHLRRISNATNTRLAEVAAGLVARRAGGGLVE
ncbi:MAG: ANTAR domain-containing protein [Sporichthyaceae bacterium]